MDPPTSKIRWSTLEVEPEAIGDQGRSSQATLAMRSFDDRINILNKSAAEVSATQRVYKTSNAILVLVRHKLIDNKDSVQLSEYCFNMCETVKTAIRGKGIGDLSESVRTALKELERLTSEIERTLGRWADAPHTKYNDEEVCGYKQEIQRVLGILTAPEFPPGGGHDVDERPPKLALVDLRDAATPPISGENAFGPLIRRTFDPHELPLLVEAIFSNKDKHDTIHCLRGDDAQTFIDVVDEALDRPDLLSRTRKKCLKSLYRMCGRHALLPRTLHIPLCYDRTGVASYRGGFADVWKGQHCGRAVAVKVLRMYSDSDLQRIIGKFCKEVVTWKTLRHPNVLPLIGVTMSETQFAMVSDWMANGNINDFVKAHPNVNRIELLGDVTRGLIYIHSQGMCHGDLKGANILIDQTGRARLADFGLLTIISDPTNLLSSSSYTQGGTARWMSPELIAPHRFGLEDSHPTKSSDCYALGMVIYETISGHLPFHKHADLVVFTKVLEGERPPREVGFTDSLWDMLGLCWAPQPDARPSVEEVLQYLERPPQSLETPLGIDEDMDEGDDWDSASDSSVHSASGSVRVSPHPIASTSPSLSYDPLSPIPSSQSFPVPSGTGQGRPEHTFDQRSPVPAGDLPDQESDSRPRVPSLNRPLAPPHNNFYHSPHAADSWFEPDGSLVDLDEQEDHGLNLYLLTDKPQTDSTTTGSPVSNTNVPTIATAEASERRRKADANFVCPVPGCGSTFTRRFNLKDHMRSHNEETLFHFDYQPHKCEGCEESFQSMDALNQHPQGGWNCQRAQDEAWASGPIDSAGLNSTNSMGSGPPDFAGSFVDLNKMGSIGGDYRGGIND